MTLNEFLKQQAEQGVSKYAIAQKLGMSQVNLLDYYIRKGKLGREWAKKVFDIFGVKVDGYCEDSVEDKLNSLLARLDSDRNIAINKLENILNNIGV